MDLTWASFIGHSMFAAVVKSLQGYEKYRDTYGSLGVLSIQSGECGLSVRVAVSVSGCLIRYP